MQGFTYTQPRHEEIGSLVLFPGRRYLILKIVEWTSEPIWTGWQVDLKLKIPISPLSGINPRQPSALLLESLGPKGHINLKKLFIEK